MLFRSLIFNEWFRDENLVTSFIVDTGDGPDPSSYYSILNRGKRHDYFTSCFPVTIIWIRSFSLCLIV